MMESLTSFLLSLLYAIHWTGDAFKVTPLPQSSVNFVSFYCRAIVIINM